MLLGAFLVLGLVRFRRRFVAFLGVASLAASIVALPAMLVLATNHAEVMESTRRTVEEVRTFSLDPGDQLQTFGWAPACVPIVLAGGVGARDRRVRPYMFAFLFVGLSGVVLALPPDVTLGSVRMPLPSRFAFETLSIWRVIGRAMVLPMLALAVLLGGAVSAAQDRSAPGRRLLSLLVAVALVAWSGGAIDVGAPSFPVDRDPELAALLRSTPGRVAEYPMFGFDNAIGPYLVRQIRHGRPLLNGGLPGTVSAELAALAAQPLDPQSADALAVAGVTRVVAHDGAPVPSDLVEVGRTSSGIVYDVPQLGNPAVAFVREVVGLEAVGAGASIRWLGRGARIDVVSVFPGDYSLLVAPVSYGAPRKVRIAGRVEEAGTVPGVATVCVRTVPGQAGLAHARALIEVEQPLDVPGLEARGVGVGIVRAEVASGCG